MSLGEIEADDEGDEDRDDRPHQPRAKLDQMLDQRRLRGLDVDVVVLMPRRHSRRGSGFGRAGFRPASCFRCGGRRGLRWPPAHRARDLRSGSQLRGRLKLLLGFLQPRLALGLAQRLVELALEVVGMRRTCPMVLPKVRSMRGSSFGPTTTIATTAMTRISLQPISNIGLRPGADALLQPTFVFCSARSDTIDAVAG